uniref:Cyclic AMP-dependent transcription factor ATF-4 n=1 Tax=Paramormyrops kingsleyae TaxID=1676925 RepID=A0A3B3RNN1_9TELE|nr:cyclic AMP-dependent transcription factor ATF-4-like [Paramormyrops kingsleyae]
MSLSMEAGLEDVGALFSGSSFLMADPFGPLLDKYEEKPSLEGPISPLSFSYPDSTSSLHSLFPPSSPPSLLGNKAGDELLALSWLSEEILDAPVRANNGREDAFSGMDWMAEKIDFNEFDLDSLIGSCDSDESPSSPEDLLASLESEMDLDSLQFPSPTSQEELRLALPSISSLSPSQDEFDVKLEPASPAPSQSPSPTPSLTSTFTLELGSEVDVSEGEKLAPSEGGGTPQMVLSLPTPHIVLVLAPKEEEGVLDVVPVCSEDLSDGDSGVGSDTGSPEHSPCLSSPVLSISSLTTKPYSRPVPAVQSPVTAKVKSVSSPPKVVEKKLKKMEQNKTAATRYRQKKRVEHDTLNAECSELEKRNQELSEKADSLSKEIQYLKDLIEEVRAAKNRRNNVRKDAS